MRNAKGEYLSFGIPVFDNPEVRLTGHIDISEKDIAGMDDQPGYYTLEWSIAIDALGERLMQHSGEAKLVRTQHNSPPETSGK